MYEREIDSSLSFYVVLLLHQRYDSFTIEIAYSENRQWPASMAPQPDPYCTPQDGQVRFRLSQLWAVDLSKDYWWWLEREVTLADFSGHSENRESIDLVISRIDNAVNDATERIFIYGISYFRQIAAAHGVEI